MSTTESDSVKQVREKIIQLAKEIEEHSRSNMPPEAFFSEFLRRVVGAVGARAGAVWLRNGTAKLNLFTDLDLKKTGYFEKADAPALNQKLLDEVMSNGQACTHSPNDGSGVQVPTNDLIVLASLQQQKQCVGVVEIFQRVDTPHQARPGFLQFVEQMCGYACRYLDRQSTAKTPENKPKLTEQFEQFLLQLHRSLDVGEVAATAANDGRLLLGCDRLSVAVQYGQKTVIKAISGQDSVHQRANLVKRMRDIANKVILMREPLTYSGKLDHLPPQITTPLADYIQESGSRMVIVWPLFESDAVIKADEKGVKRIDKQKKPIGGLIIEQISESQPRPGLQEKVESLSDHISESMHNSLKHNRLFLLPVWDFLGETFRFMEGRGKLKALGVVVAVAALVAALCIVPWDYRVEGQGRLMPRDLSDVFAPADGNVADIAVKGGDRVQAGDVLLRLQSPDLLQAQVTAQTTLHEKQSTRYSLLGELDVAKKNGNNLDITRLEGKIEATDVEIAGAQKLLGILKRRVDDLTVVAPRAGTIATFEVERQLQNRPVRRGELLLEIKDEAGPWWLQLEVQESRMGHLLRAVEAKLDQTVVEMSESEPKAKLELDSESRPVKERSLKELVEDHRKGIAPATKKEHERLQKLFEAAKLNVEFQLATNVEDRFNGQLSKANIETRSNASSAKDKAIVNVRVDIDKGDLDKNLDSTQLRIGAEVRAKINCGQRSLGYVLFGDVVEFIQKYLWL
ncbi:MAG: HlyD family efflux transporter periplasmic adaptor subunit [Planctomycetaceae bacterium]